MSHYQEVYQCGHSGRQCRCPGPKEIRRVPGLCGPQCSKAVPTPPKSKGWIGVDFDGTLAEYHSWDVNGHAPGNPVPLMVNRVRRWLEAGTEVRIFTARVSCGENEDPMPAHRQRVLIQRWCAVHIGPLAERIAVTNKKDFDMMELWDDRAVTVGFNTGITIGDRTRDR